MLSTEREEDPVEAKTLSQTSAEVISPADVYQRLHVRMHGDV
jgi:hypothetical protein